MNTKKVMKNLKKNKVAILVALFVILFLGGFFTGKVVFEEKVISIPSNIMSTFNDIYNNNTEETVLCLVGSKTLGGWEIKDVIRPNIIQTDYNIMTYESCGALERDDIIGSWHNHNEGLCELSDSDIFAFGEDYAQYKLPLAIVQCDINKIGIFTKEIINQEGYTFEQDSLNYEII